MLAGRLAPSIGAFDNASEFTADTPTLAHYLSLLGYHTILCGKMHFIGPDQLRVIGAGAYADFRRCFMSILCGSVIGVVLGAIPGIGGAPSAFLSYSEARRTSRDPDRFGKGEIEGVTASEAGKNGTCGATLIPLLALGVPGAE